MNLTETHKELLEKASKALRERTFFAAFPEHPKSYAEDAASNAANWFGTQLNNPFTELLQDSEEGWKGSEVSPFTQELLNIKYPYYSVDRLVARAKIAQDEWRYASPEMRAAVLVDSLERIKTRFFDIAYATMHTTGQSYMMAFQASGPHANDRALEALTVAYEELKRVPNSAEWEKPMGKSTIKVHKKWRAIGRGIGLVIGCSTFPVWNSVPGIFADLITGNPVIMKPHPGAILPIAIVVAEIQKSLVNYRYSADVIQLAVDTTDDMITKDLAENSQVKIIDYTGGTRFGDYLESLPGKEVFTEKAGVNSVIIDSVKDLEPVMMNLAFAATLYSGQMCTAPQNFFVPKDGIMANGELVPYETVIHKLTNAVENISKDPKMGPGILGAIQSVQTTQRIIDAKELEGKLLLDTADLVNPEFPHARTACPVVVELDSENFEAYSEEHFGPILLVIKTNDTLHSVRLAKELALKKGAISCGAYTTDPKVMAFIEREMEDAFTPVAFNMTGPIWMNQNAAFSDFHVTGGNPAGNASFTDSAYVSRRFVWVGHKEVIS